IPFSRLEVISNITWNILLQERVNSLFPYARKQIDTPKNIYTYKDLENIVLQNFIKLQYDELLYFMLQKAFMQQNKFPELSPFSPIDTYNK
ncbi:MAG: hypothetical protein ABF979_15740, partial [Gluconobacter sp.]|uniref:hypothetical protein n=1 Tax=Gluconobacter sp. TaxID=1876758 RepID=UPI0039EAECD1